mmetsp:Transcript_34503/g.25602  ORF Transcript_34503/g.25602 Transcript_34503/m.25602 type:complete len:108 (-) Transcript_34503:342-665(-)
MLTLKEVAFWVQLGILFFYCGAILAIWKGSQDFRQFVWSIYRHEGVQHMLHTGRTGVQELVGVRRSGEYTQPALPSCIDNDSLLRGRYDESPYRPSAPSGNLLDDFH